MDTLEPTHGLLAQGLTFICCQDKAVTTAETIHLVVLGVPVVRYLQRLDFLARRFLVVLVGRLTQAVVA